MPKKTKSAQRYRLMSDDDDHYYFVPVGREKAFNDMVESGTYEPEFESIGCCPNCYSFTDPRLDA